MTVPLAARSVPAAGPALYRPHFRKLPSCCIVAVPGFLVVRHVVPGLFLEGQVGRWFRGRVYLVYVPPQFVARVDALWLGGRHKDFPLRQVSIGDAI